MTKTGRVHHVHLSHYGKKLIDQLETEDFSVDEPLDVPFSFLFNSSWKIEHACLACGEVVTIEQNFDENDYALLMFRNINSSNFSHVLIEGIAAIFDSIEVVELDGVLYLNRTDFEYEFDFQRKSSIDLSHHTCPSCESHYLSIIRHALPTDPERGFEDGRAGSVEVAEIVMVNSVKELIN